MAKEGEKKASLSILNGVGRFHVRDTGLGREVFQAPDFEQLLKSTLLHLNSDEVLEKDQEYRTWYGPKLKLSYMEKNCLNVVVGMRNKITRKYTALDGQISSADFH